MNVPTLWRVALVQFLAVALLSRVLGLVLGDGFFEDWGWIAGPAAWMLCAAFTATVLDLALRPALTGAVLAGIPSLLAVAVGLHWAGALLAIALFALWCAWQPQVSQQA